MRQEPESTRCKLCKCQGKQKWQKRATKNLKINVLEYLHDSYRDTLIKQNKYSAIKGQANISFRGTSVIKLKGGGVCQDKWITTEPISPNRIFQKGVSLLHLIAHWSPNTGN